MAQHSRASRLIRKRSRRQKWVAIASVVSLLAGFGVIFAGPADAVHDLQFQLDGDVRAANIISGSTQPFDWDSLFNSSGASSPTLPDASRPGFTASNLDRDFQICTAGACNLTNTTGSFGTNDTTTFATGSKDTLPISPGWQCNFDSNVNSKIDIMNAYSAAYTDPATGDEILYFGMERNTNTGDANVAFWFLQDDVNCASTGGSEPFTGSHADGDILIVSAFTNGGGVSNISAYRWNQPAGTVGSLGTSVSAVGGDCKTTTGPDKICATTNSGTRAITGTITTPWLTSNKQDGPGHTLRISEFFEGGINLTKSGLGGHCFNVFIGDTRSSQSTTATLFDYARGKLGECNVTMTTTPSQTTRVITSTTAITDTADVVGHTSGSGDAPTPTGTVDFFLCGPSELTPANTGTCQGTSGTAVTGNPVTVAQKLDGSNQPVPSTATATSGDAQSLISGIGRYCFRALFTAASTDTNYNGQTAETDNLSGECFTVTGTAGISTAQNWVPNDTATLTGDGALNGTLVFNLYGSGTCATPGTSLYSKTVTVTNAASGSTFDTDNVDTVVAVDPGGSYFWKVSYNDNVLADPDPACEASTVTITD